MKLTSAPNLSASMRQSPLYRTLGAGLTDRIFLLGHADGIPLNTPLPVTSVRDAMDAMANDVDSPLVGGLVEAVMAGARDIWLMAVAPMSEYEPLLEDRDAAYYATYSDRLDTAYELLKTYDLAQITVPIDAPFNSSVDFLTPLVKYCNEAFVLTGEIHLGIIGTRGQLNEATVSAMTNDGRLGNYVEDGKYVGIFAGDVSFNFKELQTRRVSSAAVSMAALMSQLPSNKSVVYTPLKQAIGGVGYTPKKAEINALAEAGVNYVGPNSVGRRGRPFQVVAFSDNTLAKEGSDYWSFLQMRLVSQISIDIRSMGQRALGTIGFGLFRNEVHKYLIGLVQNRSIREYDVVVQRDPNDKTRVFVDLSVKPYFGVREITVDILVGPSFGGGG